MASDATKLKVLQQAEQAMLTGAPVEEAAAEKREVSATEKATADELKQLGASLNSAIAALNDIEVTTTNRDVARAEEIKTRDAIQAKELAKAETPSSEEAKAFSEEILAMKRKVVMQKSAFSKAEGKLEVVKEASEKKQQALVEAGNTVEENIGTLKLEAGKAADADEFEAITNSAQSMSKQRASLLKQNEDAVSKHKTKMKALKEAADAARKAVQDAMKVAEVSSEHLEGLNEKVTTTTDPEALTELKGQVKVASTAQTDAFSKLDEAKLVVKKQQLAVLEVGKVDVKAEEEARRQLKANLLAAKEAHAEAEENAQKTAMEFAKQPSNKVARETAENAAAKLEKTGAEVKDLQAKYDVVAEAEARKKQAADLTNAKAEASAAITLQKQEAQKVVEVNAKLASKEEDNKRLDGTNEQQAGTIKALMNAQKQNSATAKVAAAKAEGEQKMKDAMEEKESEMAL